MRFYSEIRTTSLSPINRQHPVLGKISTMPKPSFIVLDEVLGGVAEENYENIKKLYDRILPDYSFIFHICHLQQLEEWSQQTVVVKKENNVSKVLEVQR